MPSTPFTAGLHELAAGTYAYLQPSGSWGLSNCGLIKSADGQAVLVDTLFTLGLTRDLLAAIEARLPGTNIATVVNTHANGDHSWGNELLPQAVIVASADTAAGMHEEIPPAAMTAMTADSDPASPIGKYMRKFFAGFDFSGITITPPTHTFTGKTTVLAGDRDVILTEVGPAHTSGDVVVHVPDTGVVYAGDILFINDHPVMWSGPIAGWIAACDHILSTGADIIVPGHGPVTDRAGVAEFQRYLDYVGTYAERQCSQGVPYYEAAAAIPLAGYEAWGHPERLVVTFGAIYRALGQPDPGGREALILRMAARYQDLAARND